MFAGGFVYSVIPHGVFGADDVAIRAAITGAVAGVTCLLVLPLSKRRDRSRYVRNTGGPSTSQRGVTPKPGSSGAASLPCWRCGAPAALLTVT